MRYHICLLCPDRHLSYDGATPDAVGVGGGVTARVRVARALARLGHSVTLMCNCPEAALWDGVRYLPLETPGALDADVLILNSTGGALDLGTARNYPVTARLRVAWVGGVGQVRGLREADVAYVYVPSNFIRRVVRDDWGLPADRVFVSYNGVEMAHFAGRSWGVWDSWRRRDPYRLVYTGHPAKGLDAALATLRMLRANDTRFELHVYGGPRLWGQQEKAPESESGVVYHGLVGQRRLARELRRASVSLNLQAMPEAFGIGMAEAMAAGCIPVASPVGAFPELVASGRNGILIPGKHTDPGAQAAAANAILSLAREPQRAAAIRREATRAPIDWTTIARAWVGHWDWVQGQRDDHAGLARTPEPCPDCAAPLFALADGAHCASCGLFQRGVGSPGPVAAKGARR